MIQRVLCLLLFLAPAVFCGVPVGREADCATKAPPTNDGDGKERECGCHAENIWLDVVIAFDNSASMGQIGLSQIAATIVTAVNDMTIGQGLVHQTRVGLVTYNADATVVASLTQFTSTLDLQTAIMGLQATNVDQVNLLAALNASDQVVGLLKTPSKTRKIVFVLIASAYTEGQADPTPFANQIKAAGRKIMTIAVVRNDEGEDEVTRILALASDGYGFRTDTDADIDTRIPQQFCQANCFCPNTWTQLEDTSRKKIYGECLLFSSAPASWFAASFACVSLAHGRGFLASDFSQLKHAFNADVARKALGTVPPFHIGLSFHHDVGRYLWEEKSANGSRIALGPRDYDPWCGGTENHAKLGDGVQTAVSGFNTCWRNEDEYKNSIRYLCQQNACDADNYCTDAVDV